MRILVVDDDDGALDALRELLSGRHEVVCAKDGDSALKLYFNQSFDLVITDYNMPGMTGIDVLKRIRTENPAARVIILTGYADVENAIAAVNLGAYAFFRKPLDVQDFLKTISELEDDIRTGEMKRLDYKLLAQEYMKLKAVHEDLVKLLQEKGVTT